jgi:hypothetical protein
MATAVLARNGEEQFQNRERTNEISKKKKKIYLRDGISAELVIAYNKRTVTG